MTSFNKAATKRAARRDISGWETRLNEEMISLHTQSGKWTGRTLAQCARACAEEFPDRVAVIDGDIEFTFGQLFDRASRLADALRSQGIGPGDVISFQLPNWHEALVINLAAAIGGLVCAPIVPIYRDAEVGTILRSSRTKVFFIPDAYRNFDYVAMVNRLRAAGLPELRTTVLVRASLEGCCSYADLIGKCAERSICPAVDPNAVKLLLYTSGTTGDPKGVLHSHNTLRAEIDAAAEFWKLTSNDAVLMPSPVTHITGYLYALELPFAVGLKAILMDRWNASDALRLIAEHEVSFSIGATPFLIELVSEVERHAVSLPSLRLYGSGGAPVPPEVINRAAQVLPNCLTVRVYGSSEAPTVSLGVAPGHSAVRGATTDGFIVNHEVQVVDAIDGCPLRPGEVGEIITKGPEVMLGYTDPAYTQEAFDDQGFFHTGDLGHVSADGYITISGRKKDIIIRGGEKISPKEIEDALHRHPTIQEAAVVAMHHDRMGETPCAYVVLRPGKNLTFDEMIEFLQAERLARQKFPERLQVLDELPHTASGKVLKHVLRAWAADDAKMNKNNDERL